MPLIEAKNICKSFGKKDAAVHALRGVSLTVEEGEAIAVMGKSGSGKSTLLNILGGLMAMDSGELLFKGKPLDFSRQRNLMRYRRDVVGFVVQYFALVEDLTVYDNVALPLRYRKISQKQIKEKTDKAMAELEITDKIKAYPDELSGGQQQRVSIARAVVKDPKILLADEPTGALDVQTENAVLDIFGRLHQKGKTIIIVTHDEKVANTCDRIIRISDGLIAV